MNKKRRNKKENTLNDGCVDTQKYPKGSSSEIEKKRNKKRGSINILQIDWIIVGDG